MRPARTHAPTPRPTEPPSLAPPPAGRWLGPLGLALVAHGLLLLALTWGVNWSQRKPQPVAFEVEIWAAQPQNAAASPAPAAKRPARAPKPASPPVPVTSTPVPLPAPDPTPRQPDIATQKSDPAPQKTAPKIPPKAPVMPPQTPATEPDRAPRAQEEQERQKDLRQTQMQRIMSQAASGQTSPAQAQGNAPRASGPSAAYAARVAARIRPNVVFTEALANNPRTEVEVRALPDGSIIARRIVQPSGNPAWDLAVLRAIDRTASLPRDTDGRVPSALILVLSPQD